MSKPFSQYTDGELLAIDNEVLNIAIRVEAIERGVKPPITISEALRQSEWRGYQKPAEGVKVFRILSGYEKSAFGWLDETKATAALEGLVKVSAIGFSESNGFKIENADCTLEAVYFGVEKSVSKGLKFEGFFADDTEFNKVRDECLERLSEVRQADYNRRVNGEKRAEYMRLAGGNEDIARAFWAKTQGSTSWPEAMEGGVK
jgi:hypothetical protein